jgi:Tfp pilus assembly protein PilF
MKKLFILGAFILLNSLSIIAQQSARANYAISIKEADSLFTAADYVNARRAYESLINVDEFKNSAMEWNRLALCCHALGDFKKAVNYYNKSLQLNPSSPLDQQILYRLSKTYMSIRDENNAINCLQKAVEKGYPNFVDMDTASEFLSLHGNGEFKLIVIKAKDNAFPCMNDPHNREFDFWVGEWNAYITGTKILAGHSVIEKASGDCMILENWTSARVPFNGKSMNFIDPETKKWEQVWVGSNGGGNQVGKFINGEYKDSVMRFEFQTSDAKNNKLIGRFSFFNQGPQQVRQLNETSADGGKTWTIVYDFTYKRIR